MEREALRGEGDAEGCAFRIVSFPRDLNSENAKCWEGAAAEEAEEAEF
jgi:hypothetical protein